VLRGLRMKTGFSAVELFRKYLWYALRERKFDADTVADLVHLREQLDLSDDQVSVAWPLFASRPEAFAIIGWLRSGEQNAGFEELRIRAALVAGQLASELKIR